MLGFAASGHAPRRVAILGNAAGTTARAYGVFFPAARVDGVEIDPKLSEIGRRYFDMRNPRLHLYHEDARPFIRRIDADYDVITVDAYRQPYIPFYLTTKEFFEEVRDHLRPHGVLVLNAGHPEGQDGFEKVLSATIGAAFPHVMRDPVKPTNTLIVASRAPLSRDGTAPGAAGPAASGGRAGPGARADRWRRVHRRQGAGRVADRQVDRGLRGGGRLASSRHGLPQVRARQLRRDVRRAQLGRAGALQHRPRRLRQARARAARDGLGGLARRGAPGQLRRAAGPLQPLRQRARGDRRGARRPGRDAAAVAAGDRRGLPRHLQARRDPALAVRALRRRRHPAPAGRLAGQGRGHGCREPPPHPGGDGGEGGGDGRPRRGRRRRLRRDDGACLGPLRSGRHRRRRPGPALLLVRHHGQGEGHPARAPLPARPRGVRVLPRREGRRALPRLRRVGLGRGDLPAARAVALRGRGPGPGPQGRIRPRGAPGLPLEARRAEHVHHADRAAGDDGQSRTPGRATRSASCG